jgi:hypothetical protein
MVKKLYKIQFQFLTEFNLENLIRPEMFALDFKKFNTIQLASAPERSVSLYIQVVHVMLKKRNHT